LKVKVLKKVDNEFKIEIEGSTHGLCNLVTKRLLEDKHVDFAGYDVPHPLAASPVIYIKMKGKAKPEDAILEAIDKAKDANDAFAKELDRVFKS
jgi:DNA-directed RNA polymerase subunit L